LNLKFKSLSLHFVLFFGGNCNPGDTCPPPTSFIYSTGEKIYSFQDEILSEPAITGKYMLKKNQTDFDDREFKSLPLHY
jgi:hypothetical protein